MSDERSVRPAIAANTTKPCPSKMYFEEKWNLRAGEFHKCAFYDGSWWASIRVPALNPHHNAVYWHYHKDRDLQSMLDAFKMFARYNRLANEKLYESCGQLSPAEYRRERQGSFGSIHALLNHLLLGDRIWMSRFAGGGQTTPPLDTVLFHDFADLYKARMEQDTEIQAFFEGAGNDLPIRSLRYTNSRGKDYVEPAGAAILHFFNHQTHHRGQVHVMLSEAGFKPPSLDMHRLLNP